MANQEDPLRQLELRVEVLVETLEELLRYREEHGYVSSRPYYREIETVSVGHYL